MTRDYTLKTRLTEAEHDILEDRSLKSGVSMADIVRQSVFGTRHMRKLPGAAELVESRRLIKNIADNVNQATKALNSASLSGDLNDELAKKHLIILAKMFLEFKSSSTGIAEFMVALDHS